MIELTLTLGKQTEPPAITCAAEWLCGGVGLCNLQHVWFSTRWKHQHQGVWVLGRETADSEGGTWLLVIRDVCLSKSKLLYAHPCLPIILKTSFLFFYVIAKSIIQDLKKNFEIVKLVTGSLISCHRLAASVAGPGGLVGATLVDGRYTYREVPNFFTLSFHFWNSLVNNYSSFLVLNSSNIYLWRLVVALLLYRGKLCKRDSSLAKSLPGGELDLPILGSVVSKSCSSFFTSFSSW